jgi:hypothetical protein
MKAPEARKLIGKAVSYRHALSSFPPRVGIVEDVRGRNVRIDSNWLWLPDVQIVPVPVLAIEILSLGLESGPTPQ